MTDMPAVDRRHRILERVAEEQTIHIARAGDRAGVSEMTIRRDISRLERDGFLRRTYGGATAHITRSLELAFNAARSAERAGQAADRDGGGAARGQRLDALRRHRHDRRAVRALPAGPRRRHGRHRLAAGGEPARHAAAGGSSSSVAACADGRALPASARSPARPCAATTRTWPCWAPPALSAARGDHRARRRRRRGAAGHDRAERAARRPGRRVEDRRGRAWRPSRRPRPSRRS